MDKPTYNPILQEFLDYHAAPYAMRPSIEQFNAWQGAVLYQLKAAHAAGLEQGRAEAAVELAKLRILVSGLMSDEVARLGVPSSVFEAT